MTNPTDPEPLIPGTGPTDAPDVATPAESELPMPALPGPAEPAQPWFARSVPDTPQPAETWSTPSVPGLPEPAQPWSTPSVPGPAEPAQPWFTPSLEPEVGSAPQSEAAAQTYAMPLTDEVPLTGAVPQSAAAHPAAPQLPADAVPSLAPVTPPPKRRGGLVAVVALIVVGLLGLLGGGAALSWELTRKATQAEQAAALRTEIASRWQRLPAGKIFPAAISYKNAEGYPTAAIRVGIAPQTSCQVALEPNAVPDMRSYGCAAVLRATYVDAAGTQVVTVGIAAMPSESAALSAQGAVEALDSGASLRAMPITGTIAGTFSDAQRGTAEAQFAGPYIFLYTAGYTDGMPGTAAGTNTELSALGDSVLAVLETTMTKHTPACTMKDIKC